MRPSFDDTFMQIAHVLSKRGTCPRRQVGCVLVDNIHRIIGSGYNGSPHGAPHCIDVPCKGMKYQHGEGLDMCESIHAEQNALLQCRDVQSIYTCYTTSFPCTHCFKMIANTACLRIVYEHPYNASLDAVMAINESLSEPLEIVPHVSARSLYGDKYVEPNFYKQTP